jgi:hypothetical protein
LLAILWSGLLTLFDFAEVLISNFTSQPGTAWVTVGFIGQCLLTAAGGVLLATGLRRPSWRKAAAITAWMIIPASIGWSQLISHLAR